MYLEVDQKTKNGISTIIKIVFNEIKLMKMASLASKWNMSYALAMGWVPFEPNQTDQTVVSRQLSLSFEISSLIGFDYQNFGFGLGATELNFVWLD